MTYFLRNFFLAVYVNCFSDEALEIHNQWSSKFCLHSTSLTLDNAMFFFFVFFAIFFSIHEKANCIAMFWTGRLHSLGSCHFRRVWATCLPHKGGASS